MKSLCEAKEIHIVIEAIDGQVCKTRLPREQAETLYRKLRTAGAEVEIFKEVIEVQTEHPVEFENEAW